MYGGMVRGWAESLSTSKSYQLFKRVQNGYELALTFIDPLTGRKKAGYVNVFYGALTQEETQLLYDEAVKKGHGTEEERALMRDFIEDSGEWAREAQKGFFKLTWESRGRFLNALKSAYYVQRTNPELVAREIEWVAEQLGKA